MVGPWCCTGCPTYNINFNVGLVFIWLRPHINFPLEPRHLSKESLALKLQQLHGFHVKAGRPQHHHQCRAHRAHQLLWQSPPALGNLFLQHLLHRTHQHHCIRLMPLQSHLHLESPVVFSHPSIHNRQIPLAVWACKGASVRSHMPYLYHLNPLLYLAMHPSTLNIRFLFEDVPG